MLLFCVCKRFKKYIVGPFYCINLPKESWYWWVLRSNSKHKGTFVARKLKRRCHNFVPQSWYLLWVKHLETVPPPAIRLWVFPLGGWRRKQTLATVQQTDFWFQNGTLCCPIIHRRTNNKFIPILMRVQTYQITILCPFRVFVGSTSHAIFLCSWYLEIWQSSWVTN